MIGKMTKMVQLPWQYDSVVKILPGEDVVVVLGEGSVIAPPPASLAAEADRGQEALDGHVAVVTGSRPHGPGSALRAGRGRTDTRRRDVPGAGRGAAVPGGWRLLRLRLLLRSCKPLPCKYCENIATSVS